jgi:hypothetical protein
MWRALAVTIGLLERRADEPAIGAHICLERAADAIGMDEQFMRDAWVEAFVGNADYSDCRRLASFLLGDNDRP